VVGPLFVGLAVLSGPLVQILYGDRWIAASVPLSVLMLTLVVALACSLNWELCVLRHLTAWQARNEGIRAVVGWWPSRSAPPSTSRQRL
jgi:O-antigen/teichoic acid export membrane protein